MRSLDEPVLLRILTVALILGVAIRLAPLVLGEAHLTRLFMTEDGYLMLTVARNLAIGNGLSVSDGTIATNGVQPLATLLFAGAYLSVGGDRMAGLVGVHLIAAAAAVAGALALRALAGRVLALQGAGPVWAWAAATLWFLGPILLGHSMNGLETGLYTLAVLLVLLQFWRVIARGAEAGTADRLLLALLCGLAFLARNDAVFLIAAVGLCWLVHALAVLRLGPGRTLARAAAPAAVVVAVAAPWLLYNLIGFGSVVPVSGTAQSITAGFGQNAPLLPAILFEHMFPMFPIPGRFETLPAVQAVTALTVAGVLAGFLVQVWRRDGPARVVLAAYALFGVGIAGYYGFFFGAQHFLSRYTAPLAPLLIVAALSVAIDLARALVPRMAERVLVATSLAALLLIAGLLGQRLAGPVDRPGPFTHFQVVEWVEANVPEDTWVGAVQTGWLGYWHDRTINLDGKVNPAALEARRERGHVLDYVVASEIDYLADWVGIADWVNRPHTEFGDRFEVVVRDTERNLAVLRRRDAPGRD